MLKRIQIDMMKLIWKQLYTLHKHIYNTMSEINV